MATDSPFDDHDGFDVNDVLPKRNKHDLLRKVDSFAAESWSI